MTAKKTNGSTDPSANVLDLVDAAIQRQDDLREAEALRINQIAEIRDRHAKELRLAEAERIDSIRAVDAQAVQQAAAVQDTRATALAGQVAASAEAMRSQVAAAAEAAATALATALAPITTSIEQLRQAMYEAQGQKTQVVETQAKTTNTSLWIGLAIAASAVVASVFIGVATITVVLLTK